MKQISSQKTEIKVLMDFELCKIKETFHIPEFERRLGSMHVRKIVEAIKNNRFYDNVIRVTKINESKYEVLDGQHRLSALWCVHKEQGLKKYDLVIQIFNSEFARTVFRRLNMGKPLNLEDHTKALDDGTKLFFNKLHHLLNHKQQPNRTTFTNILHAIKYAKTGSPVTVKPYRLEKFIETINKEDIEFCKRFLQAMYNSSPTVPHSTHFKSAVFRNAYRLGYENNLETNEISKLVDAMIKNPKLIDYVESSALKDISILYRLSLLEFSNILGKTPIINNNSFDKQLTSGVI